MRNLTMSVLAFYIGMATMQPDGTIIMDMRAESDKGDIGIGRLVYSPSDPQYQEILKHLGGLKPGEPKPVPPFPDKK
jgi:hypothetical protein